MIELTALIQLEHATALEQGVDEARVLRARLTEQPSGDRGRRPMSQADRKMIVKQADAAREKQAISHEAWSFLTEWAKGTLRRHPRPTCYSCLAPNFVFCQLLSPCLKINEIVNLCL